MSSIDLSWYADGVIDSYNVYRSETPMNPASLPTPIITGVTNKSYSDSSPLVTGKTYYYRVSSVVNGIEKISNEISLLAGILWTPLNLTTAPKSFITSSVAVIDTSNRVSQLTDQTGKGYDFIQSNNTLKPLLINNVVRFDGVDDSLSIVTTKTDIYISKSYFYLFFTIGINSASSNIKPVFITTIGNSTKIGLHQFNATQMRFSLRSVEADTLQSIFFNYSLNEKMILFCEADLVAKTAKVFKNGTLVGSISLTTTSSTFPNITPSIYPQIGNGGSGVTAWAGDLMSFSTDVNKLAAGEQQKLEGWAAHEYGLTANLPSDHPYKTLVPTL